MSKNQSYSPEFRAEAVKLVLEQGLLQEGAGKRLAIPKGTLRGWVAVAKSGDRGRLGARSVAENLLNQQFSPTAPNQTWVADLIDIGTGEGWLYLAGLKDVLACEIVGDALGERMTQALTGRALLRAIQYKYPPERLNPPFGPGQPILQPRPPGFARAVRAEGLHVAQG